MEDIIFDKPYFKMKLEIILRDIESYTPAELARALARLAKTSSAEVLNEDEFSYYFFNTKNS